MKYIFYIFTLVLLLSIGNSYAEESNFEKLAYLRQKMVIAPYDKEIRSEILKLKQEILKDKSPASISQKESFLNIVAIKNYVPYYLEQNLLLISSISLALSLVFLRSIILNFSLFLILIFLATNYFFITYTRDGSLRLIKEFSDIFKSEGIALKEFKVYSSPDSTSQITYIIKPGDELDVFDLHPKDNDWIRLKFENGRSGWIQYHGDELYIIKR